MFVKIIVRVMEEQKTKARQRYTMYAKSNCLPCVSMNVFTHTHVYAYTHMHESHKLTYSCLCHA